MTQNITWYLAAPWAEREMAKSVRAMLVSAGHAVNSRWLDFAKDAGTGGLDLAGDALRQEAMNDIEDIINADAFLLLNTQDRGAETSGKAVETGAAIAMLKPIVIVGKRTNVFHFLNIPFFPTIEEALEWLKEDGLDYLTYVQMKQAAYLAHMDADMEVADMMEEDFPSE